MKKNYVVRVKSPSAWPEIHELLITEGTSCDTVPSRCCECTDTKEYSKYRSTYLLDEEEADLLRSNDAVDYVELDPGFHMESYPIPEPSALVNRFPSVTPNTGDPSPFAGYKNYRTTFDLSSISPPVPTNNRPPATSPGQAEHYRTGYQFLRTATKADPFSYRVPSAFGFNVNGIDINWQYAADPITLPPETPFQYEEGEDGSDVDVLIVDDGAWLGHPEFVSEAGVSLVRDLVLDGPYYIDPDYFISNGLVVTFLGRLTCEEQAARDWWRDSTKRSAKFATIGTIPSIDDGYTRAAVCGDFSNLPANFVAEHGTPCASMAYGKTFGWAFNANKWTIAARIGTGETYLISTPSICFDIVKIFHKNKPLNPNRNNTRDPLVINNSYNYLKILGSSGSYKFRNNAASTYTGGTINAPNFLQGISRTNALPLFSVDQPSLRSSGDELLDEFQDIIFFVSAGNTNQKYALPQDEDYNNWFSYTGNINPSEIDKVYVNRRGYPADTGGYLEQDGGYRTIAVGALSAWKGPTNKEGKAYYSSAGRGVDFFSPGGYVLCAVIAENTYERYDSNSFYPWLNIPAYDGEIGGTSSASPVAAGFIASKLSKYRNWTTKTIKSYINNIVQKQDTATSFEVGANPSTQDDTAWLRVDNLFGQDPIILYNEPVPDPVISINLPSTVVTNSFGNVVLSVSPGVNQFADSYSYQWEKKLPGESEFSIIPGDFNAIYFEKIETISQEGTEYRVLIIPNGPYNPVYSDVSTLSVTPFISINNQSNDTSSVLTTPFNLFVSVGLSVAGVSLSYQWQKLNTNTSLWVDLEGKTGPSYFKGSSEEGDAGSYRCVISSPGATNSPVISNTITLSILPVFTITIITQPRPTRVDFGDQATFRVNAVTDSGKNIEYQWQRSFDNGQTWGSINSATQPVLILQSVTDQDSGLYRCVLFDAFALNSTVISDSAFLSVSKSTLSITNQPNNVSSFIAGSATFEIEALSSGAGAISYQWQKSTNSGETWVNIPNANGSTFEIFNISTSDAALYRCIVLDNVSFNSPVFSTAVRLTIFDVVLTITGEPIGEISIIEGEELSISAGATLSDGRSPSFRWEKLNGSSWELIETNSSGVLTFPRIPLSSAGVYRCTITDPSGLAQGSPFVSSTSTITVTDSFEVKGVVNPLITTSIGNEIELGVVVEINNPILPYVYTWQKKEDGSDIWTDIPNSNSAQYSFVTSGIDYLDTYRCKVDNVIGNVQFSDIITLILNPFVDIIKQPPTRVNFKNTSNEDQNITFEIASTSVEDVTYQWQISTNNVFWSNIEGKTNIELLLTPEDVLSLSSNDYYLRCKVTFDINGNGSVLQEIFTNSTLIDLKTSINLFGDTKCLNESQAFNLRRLNVDSDAILQNDLCGDQNSCGDSIDQLLEKYSFYSQQRGLYSSWGGIDFPWEISDQTPNIIFSQTDSRWSVSKYREFIAYFPGDRVLLIEEDGYELAVYEALENVFSIAGPFEYSKWNKVCSVKTTIPVGLPTADFLRETYDIYSIDYFYKEWENVESTWSEEVYNTSLQNCLNPLISNIQDLEKCVKNSGTDVWKEARVRKQFFYRRGDFFLTEGTCGDTVCLWTVISDVPATIENYEKLLNFAPNDYWRRLYCVKTGVNKCTSYNRNKTPELGYEVVQIGSLGNFVEVPIPYKLNRQFEIEDLDKKKEPEPNPIILTDRQIFDLEHNIYPYTTESDT